MPRRKKEDSVPEEEKVAREPGAGAETPAAEAAVPEPPAPPPPPAPEPEAAPAPPPPPVPARPAPPAGPTGPSSEERWAAAIAHGSILLNLVTGFLGPVVALVIWLLYERKSRYVAWHALQAMVFQALAIVLVVALGAISAVLWAVAAPLLLVVIGFCLLPFALGFTAITAALVLGSLIYGCAGALTVLEGRDFRYRWVAEWIPPPSRP